MGFVRFWSSTVVFWLSSVAHSIPQHGLAQRQDGSGSPSPTITPWPTLPILGNMPSKISSCPTSYPANYPQEIRVYSSKCEKAAGLLSHFHEYAEECLRIYCAWEWQTAILSYISANSTEMTTETYMAWSGAFSTGESTTVLTSQTRWRSTLTRVRWPSEVATPSAPCCGTCVLSAGTVGLYYWPTTSTAANMTAKPTGMPLPGTGSYVDESGFTFISPSVYIAFTSLGAKNRCGDVGTPIFHTTMAFDPTELSSVQTAVITATCPMLDPQGNAATYTETSIPPPVPLTLADVSQNCSTIEGYYYDPEHLLNQGAGDPCHPVIAIPDRVRALQSEWAHCSANWYGGFYDPPMALRQSSVLGPTTTDIAPTTATPGPSNPTVVPPTSVPVPALPQQSDPVENQGPPSSIPDQPNPPVSVPNQPSPPSNQPKPPSSTPGGQPNPVPQFGSSTIIIPPPNPSATQNSPPPANSLPVITLPPNPTDPSDPGHAITIIPTTLPSDPNNPQNPSSLGNAVIIGSSILTPGQAITTGGTTISLDPQGTQLIVDGSTIPITTPAQTTTTLPLVIPLGSTTLTANSETQFVFGSTTLSVGGSPVTVSGTTYVMTTNEQGSTQLVVGTGGANSTVAAPSTTGPDLPEVSVAAAVRLKKGVEAVVTVVLVAMFLG